MDHNDTLDTPMNEKGYNLWTKNGRPKILGKRKIKINYYSKGDPTIPKREPEADQNKLLESYMQDWRDFKQEEIKMYTDNKTINNS